MHLSENANLGLILSEQNWIMKGFDHRFLPPSWFSVAGFISYVSAQPFNGKEAKEWSTISEATVRFQSHRNNS